MKEELEEVLLLFVTFLLVALAFFALVITTLSLSKQNDRSFPIVEEAIPVKQSIVEEY